MPVDWAQLKACKKGARISSILSPDSTATVYLTEGGDYGWTLAAPPPGVEVIRRYRDGKKVKDDDQ